MRLLISECTRRGVLLDFQSFRKVAALNRFTVPIISLEVDNLNFDSIAYCIRQELNYRRTATIVDDFLLSNPLPRITLPVVSAHVCLLGLN